MNSTPGSADDAIADRMLEAALTYARRGWRVFPCWWPLLHGPCACGEPQCDRIAKHPIGQAAPHGRNDATTDEQIICSWWRRWPHANVAIATGPESGLVVLDQDPLHGGEESLMQLEQDYGAIPDTAVSLTGGGGTHTLFAHPRDRKVTSKVGLPGYPGLDTRADGGYVVAPPSRHRSGNVYCWNIHLHPADVKLAPCPTWLIELANMSAKPNGTGMNDGNVHEGVRNDYLFRVGCGMRGRGLAESEIRDELHRENERRCEPLLEEHELETIVGSVMRYVAGAAEQAGESFTPSSETWPKPLGEAAYHGVVGDIVRFLEPHTEADPAALLVQMLAIAGAFTGSGPYFQVEADRHPPRLFLVVVGETAKARKGTGFGCARRVYVLADRMPPRASGLSSGEGLIWAVRDAIYKKTSDGEACIDAGVPDKRLLVVESEFGGTLRVVGREGNTLSAVIRDAWDHGDLRTLTKNTPAAATGAHIAVLAHITAEELRRDLNAVDAASGFGNRFLWVCSRRSKLLPEGGSLSDQHLEQAAKELRQALDEAQQPRRWERDAEASELWRTVYPELSSGKSGMLGALTSRAEAQTMRLALVYALLDAHGGASKIQRQHLEAALEVWRYCEDSARAIFGERLGGKADEALALLRSAGPAGMSRSAIGEVVFGKHVTAAKLDAALAPLLRYGRARTGTGPVAGGRPPEWWWAL